MFVLNAKNLASHMSFTSNNLTSIMQRQFCATVIIHLLPIKTKQTCIDNAKLYFVTTTMRCDNYFFLLNDAMTNVPSENVAQMQYRD